MGIIHIENLDDVVLSPYARLTERQLQSRLHPEEGVFICESMKVIRVALEHGMQPVSFLCEEKFLEGVNALLCECGSDVPVYTAPREVLKGLTGYELSRGVLCAMRRPVLPSVEAVLCSRPSGEIHRSKNGIDLSITPQAGDNVMRREADISSRPSGEIHRSRNGIDLSVTPQAGDNVVRREADISSRPSGEIHRSKNGIDLSITPQAGDNVVRRVADISSRPSGEIHRSKNGIDLSITPQAGDNVVRRVAVLDGVVNSENTGAIFRAAAALGIDAVLLTRTCCDPLNRRACRVSMGTVFQLPWTFLDHYMQLKDCGFQTVAMALTDRSVPIGDPSLRGIDRMAIILGTEGDGLSDSVLRQCDHVARIPMQRGVDSLNVAAAAAVAFYELTK